MKERTAKLLGISLGATHSKKSKQTTSSYRFSAGYQIQILHINLVLGSKYTRDRPKFLDWIETNRDIEHRQIRTSQTPIAHSNSTTKNIQTSKLNFPKNSNSQTFINPVSSRNKSSCLNVEPLSAMQLFVLFELFGIFL